MSTKTERQLFEDATYNEDRMTAWEVWQAARAAPSRDADELQFLRGDLLYWVDRAVEKGSANSDIEEAYQRYEAWTESRS